MGVGLLTAANPSGTRAVEGSTGVGVAGGLDGGGGGLASNFTAPVLSISDWMSEVGSSWGADLFRFRRRPSTIVFAIQQESRTSSSPALQMGSSL
jgi:hypothetical protein